MGEEVVQRGSATYMYTIVKQHLTKEKQWWRIGLAGELRGAVKSTGCSSGECRLNSQHPHGSSNLSFFLSSRSCDTLFWPLWCKDLHDQHEHTTPAVHIK